jgi:hypothetical protein
MNGIKDLHMDSYVISSATMDHFFTYVHAILNVIKP